MHLLKSYNWNTSSLDVFIHKPKPFTSFTLGMIHILKKTTHFKLSYLSLHTKFNLAGGAHVGSFDDKYCRYLKSLKDHEKLRMFFFIPIFFFYKSVLVFDNWKLVKWMFFFIHVSFLEVSKMYFTHIILSVKYRHWFNFPL